MGAALEGQLRADLRTEMGYQLDRQILLGDGTGANVSGLIKQLDLVLPPGASFGSSGTANDVSAQINWAAWKKIATTGLMANTPRRKRTFAC